MDTISRESNSMLPLAGVVVGAVALLLGGYSAISLSHVKATVQAHEEKLAKQDDIATQAASAASDAAKANTSIGTLAKETQDGFNTVTGEIASVKADVAKLQEARKAPVASKGGSREPVTAGPGEYVVKSGDTLSKIARAQGCSLADLESVNPGVESSHLRVGQKIKLPSGAK